jgi:hypothetical protein
MAKRPPPKPKTLKKVPTKLKPYWRKRGVPPK